MPDAFISYSRKNIAFARLLMEAFEKNNIQAWIDWQDIPPSADWLAEVNEAIELSDAFIFIISENSVISEICSLEIAHAVKNHKRLIPIVVNEVEPTKVPAPLADLQWIFFTQQDRFSESLSDLISTLQIDQNWVKGHTRLQNRALEWNRKDRSKAAYLRGQDLNQAENWFSQASGKDPAPSVLQSDFIFASRKEANRRQRLSSIIALVGIVVAVGLGILAWIQRAEAVQTTEARSTAEYVAIEEANTRATAQVEAVLEEQANATAQAVLEDEIKTVSSRFLAAQASALAQAGKTNDENLDLSLLLSLEAVRLEDSLETRSALFSSLTAHPFLKKYLFRESGIGIENIQFDPQGSLVVINYSDQELLIFDYDQGYELQKVILPHKISVVAHPLIENGTQDGIRYCADGSLMISYASSDKIWMLWNTVTYSPIGDPFTENINRQSIISISPTFKLLATLEGEEILIWERETGNLVQTIPEPSLGLVDLPLFTYDDQLFIAPSGQGTLEIYDLDSGEIQQTIELEPEFGELEQVEINPQGTRLGAVGSDLIVVYDLTTGKVNTVYEREEDTVYTLIFNPEGQAFLRYSQYIFNQEKEVYDQENHYLEMIGEGRVLISRFESLSRWNYPTLSHMYSANNPLHKIDPVSLRIASHRSNQGNVELLLFDPLTIYPILESIAFNGEMEGSLSYTQIAFHPTEENILAVGQCSDYQPGSTCDLTVWDLTDSDPRLVRTLETAQFIRGLDFHPHDQLLAVAGSDGIILMWDWNLGEVVFDVNDFEEQIDMLDFSTEGKYLAAASSTGDAPILVFNTETGTEITQIKSEYGKVNAIAFHPQHSWLAVSYRDRVVLWDIEHDAQLSELTLDESMEIFDLLAFFPDGTQLVTGGEDGFARWDLETTEPLSLPAEENLSSGPVQYLAYDPTGTWLVSGVQDQVRLYDPDTGKFVGVLKPTNLDGVENAYRYQLLPTPAINSTGSRLVAYSRGNELLFWQLDLESWKVAACQIANRNLTQTEWKVYLGDTSYQETCP